MPWTDYNAYQWQWHNIVPFFPGNPMYERGQDNKLIIWSPGHSGTLTRPSNNQSVDDMAPRLPYQRLLTRTSSSSPDCAAAIRPVSSPGVEGGFPYQKLVRAGRSLRTGRSLRRDDQRCGHPVGLGGEGSSTEAYQSLSLQRNPLVSCWSSSKFSSLFNTFFYNCTSENLFFSQHVFPELIRAKFSWPAYLNLLLNR